MTGIKKRALRHNSLSMDVLKKLFFLHACWKSDMCAYAKTKIRAQNASTNFNNLIERGLIECINDPKYIHSVFRITKKGRLYVIDNAEKGSYFAEIDDPDEFISAYWKTSKLDRNLRGLILARIQLHIAATFDAFSSTEAEKHSVPVFMNEKPSFRSLNDFLLDSNEPAETGRDGNYISMSAHEIKRVLTTTGIFYTNTELLSYSKTDNWRVSFDKVNGSRFAGIYLRKDKCQIIYANKAGNGNRRLNIHPQTESELCRTLNNLFALYKRDYMQEVDGIDAVVMTEGPSAICSMVTGYKSGEDKRGAIDNIKAAICQEKPLPRDIVNDTFGVLDDPDRNLLKRNRVFLQHDNPLYNRIYAVCVPSPTVVQQLDFIMYWSRVKQDRFCLNQQEQMRLNYKNEMLESNIQPELTREIFIPVIDINKLTSFRRELYKTLDGGLDISRKILVSTQPDLAKTVAVCISSPAEYFHTDLSRMDFHEIYSRFGIRQDKPDRYKRDFAAIAREELEGKGKKPVKEKWPTMSVAFAPEDYNAIKKICKITGCTVSGYLRESMKKNIEADLAALHPK